MPTEPPATPFDPSLYTTAPVVPLTEAVAIAQALQAACPRDADPVVKRALRRLQERTQDAHTALLDRQREDGQALTEEETRPLDQEMDGAFGGLRLRLEGWTRLPADFPKSQRAATLLKRLFPQGMTFLAQSYPQQLTQMDLIVKLIDEDGLERELDSLCGGEFLDHIRTLLPRYRQAVQGILSRSARAGQNLFHHRTALGRALVAYATAVCAAVDDTDADSVGRAETMLRPLLTSRTPPRRPEDPAPPSPEPTPLDR